MEKFCKNCNNFDTRYEQCCCVEVRDTKKISVITGNPICELFNICNLCNELVTPNRCVFSNKEAMELINKDLKCPYFQEKKESTIFDFIKSILFYKF